MDETTAYPLSWPHGRPRAPYRSRSAFRGRTFGATRDFLVNELRLLGAHHIVLSTNIPLRQDGLPYATFRTPDDPGVAVYFEYKKKPMAFCCDLWMKVEDNMHAVAKTIEALRGIARWGTGDMMDAAFSGFVALPPPTDKETALWAEAGIMDPDNWDAEKKTRALRVLIQKYHPDKLEGDREKFELAVKLMNELR